MAYCRRCFQQGVRCEGGAVGCCAKHARRKCSGCGGVSLGEELCAGCQNVVDDVKRRHRAENPHLLTQSDVLDTVEMRAERLLQGKLFCHEAVELLFRAFLAFAQGTKSGGGATTPLPAGESFKDAA